MPVQIHHGDAAQKLLELSDQSHDCCVTSPPYWGLRDYGHGAQVGLEGSLEDYIAALSSVFAQVGRVLRPDGTLWLILGDSYVGQAGGSDGVHSGLRRVRSGGGTRGKAVPGLRRKSLAGVPWRVAFALQAAGWILRSDIVWAKPAPMPESVRDRPTRSHEYVFLLTRSPKYFYSATAVLEPAKRRTSGQRGRKVAAGGVGKRPGDHLGTSFAWQGTTRQLRDVWTIQPQPFRGAHFATCPPRLVELCLRAGCRPGGRVLDPFGGAGTTGLVAARLGLDATIVDISLAYCRLARSRIMNDSLLHKVTGP